MDYLIVGEAMVLIRPETGRFMPELEAKLQGLGGSGGAGVGQMSLFGALEGEAAGASGTIERETGKIGKATEEMASKVEKGTSKSGGLFQGLSSLVGIEAGRFGGGTNVMSSALGDLEKAGTGAQGALAGLGPEAMGAVAAIGAASVVVLGSAKAFEQWGSSVFKVHELMGGTTEDASKLTFAFQSMGIGPDQVSVAMGRLSRNLQSGHVDLQRYGVEVAHNADGTINLKETLLNLSDAMQRLGPGVQSNTLAISALGRGGAALVPILLQGRDALQGLMDKTPKDMILSEKQAETAHQFGIMINQVKLEVEGLFVHVGSKLVPELMRLLGVFDWVTQHATPVIDAFLAMVKAAMPFIGIIDTLAKVLHIHVAAADASAAATDALKKNMDGSADAIARAEESTKTLTDQLNALGSATLALVDDEKALESSQNAKLRASDDLAKAQQDYNKLLATGGADTTKYNESVIKLRDALVALEVAQNDLLTTQQSVHEKEIALAEATDQYGRDSEEARKAGVELASAHVRVDEANNKITTSTENIAKARLEEQQATAGSIESAERLKNAQDKVIEARDRYEGAVLSEARANAKLAETNDAIAGHTDDAKEKTHHLIDALEAETRTLDPNSPLYKNLEGYIGQLKDAALKQDDLNNKINGMPSSTDIGLPPGARLGIPSTDPMSVVPPGLAAAANAPQVHVHGGGLDPVQIGVTVARVLAGGIIPGLGLG